MTATTHIAEDYRPATELETAAVRAELRSMPIEKSLALIQGKEQASAPAAWWNGLAVAESNSGPWPSFNVAENEVCCIPLFTHPSQDTERLDFLIDYCCSFQNSKGEELPENSRRAIDAAIAQSGGNGS
jgi:hypothetical protein